MLVKHDAKIKVTTTYCDGRARETEIMEPKQLEGYLLVLGCMYNVSGYYNPHAPKVRIKLINKNDILRDGELCDCKYCDEKYGFRYYKVDQKENENV
jgi:hypothetical protein